MLRALFHNRQALKSLDNVQPVMRFWAEAFAAPALRFDALVIGFCVGIAIYFALPFEPAMGSVFLGAVLLGALLWLTRHTVRDIWIWGALALAIAFGLGRATWQTQSVETPRLPSFERSYDVSGWVESIAASGKGVRWHIVVDDMSRMSRDETPKKVRIRLGAKHKEAAVAGDYVQVRAMLSAPPGPIVPNGYNPAKRAFFEQVGGFGYAVSIPQVTPFTDEGGIKRRIAHLRYKLADRIYNVAPEETAGLQVALLTGVRRYIPPEQTEALRVAGLAHILAISGLHMGLLAGSAFFVFTYLLVLIAPLSRRYDVRKFAAGLGIIAATAYLILSGASVATQRAYIMAVIVFLAVILDRQAISVRSVSIAAFLTLMLHPEALVSVGFQMSFAAVLALVVVYRTWQDYKPIRARGGFVARVRNNAVSLSVTSLVAGAATAGFALFHFGRIAKYGLVGNLLAMPIFTFAVMPLGIIALLAIPFGLEKWPLWAMGQSVAQLVHISEWIEGWDGALMQVRAAPGWVIAAYGLAFILVLLGRWRGRVIGGALMAACFVGWSFNSIPDIRISEDGRVAFWETSEFQRLIVTSERADSYGRDQFAEKAGRADVDVLAMAKSEAPCDALACRFLVKGKTVSILNHPSEARVECAASDLVILTVRDVGPEVRRLCQAELIDGRALRQSGAQELYVTDKGIRRVGTKKPFSERRPWD